MLRTSVVQVPLLLRLPAGNRRRRLASIVGDVGNSQIMLQRTSTQNGLHFPKLAKDGRQRIGLSTGLPDKRIIFLSLCLLALLTIFALAPNSVLDFATVWTHSNLSSNTTFQAWISGGSQRRRRPTPPVLTTLNPIPTEAPTLSTLPTSAIATTPTTTSTPTVTPSSTATSTSTTTSTVTVTSKTTSTSQSTTLPTLPQSSSITLSPATTLRTTPLPSQRVTRRPDDVSRYVSFSGGFADGRGLGNQIFCFAAVLYVAELTGREPAIEKFNYVIQLDKVFDLNVERFDSICPCHWVEESKHLAFDEETDKKVLKRQETANKSILVGGFRQSWRYTLAIGRRLRRHLVFKEEIRKFAEEYLDKHIPPDWNRAGFTRVAIHIRRGDILETRLVDYGYTVPNVSYFTKAMSYFTERYPRVQFIALTEDRKWASENIRVGEENQTLSVHVTHAIGHSAGQDLAIMSMCDHVIMSTGTFGWWGAWLARGTTVYYSDWPRNGSGLEKQFRREDFFPPSWIPMAD